MDIEMVRNWVATIALILSATSIIVAWVKSPGEKVATRLAQLQTLIETHEDCTTEELKKHDRRIQKVENDVAHLPTKEDIASINGRLVEVSTALAGLTKTVDRMDRYLREPSQ